VATGSCPYQSRCVFIHDPRLRGRSEAWLYCGNPSGVSPRSTAANGNTNFNNNTATAVAASSGGSDSGSSASGGGFPRLMGSASFDSCCFSDDAASSCCKNSYGSGTSPVSTSGSSMSPSTRDFFYWPVSFHLRPAHLPLLLKHAVVCSAGAERNRD
jgi:hypothetical protein